MIGRSPPLPSLANMSSIDAQKQKLQTALQAFDAIIKALPKTLSAGDKNGPIAANFTSHKFDSDEGPYYSFDKAWNRTFQVPDTQPTTPSSPSKSFFMEAIRMYPCLHGNALAWWKVSEVLIMSVSQLTFDHAGP